mmetsp:Transcript_38422/g.63855  ORF Transcript_38422/g.63855 Transcript_38422/m.63855 type:complete len:207 (-) Transcript_38422:528-1148(-)
MERVGGGGGMHSGQFLRANHTLTTLLTCWGLGGAGGAQAPARLGGQCKGDRLAVEERLHNPLPRQAPQRDWPLGQQAAFHPPCALEDAGTFPAENGTRQTPGPHTFQCLCSKASGIGSWAMHHIWAGVLAPPTLRPICCSARTLHQMLPHVQQAVCLRSKKNCEAPCIVCLPRVRCPLACYPGAACGDTGSGQLGRFVNVRPHLPS